MNLAANIRNRLGVFFGLGLLALLAQGACQEDPPPRYDPGFSNTGGAGRVDSGTPDRGTPGTGGSTGGDGGPIDRASDVATLDGGVAPVAQLVPTAGGIVTNAAGVVIEIPAGALAAATTITVAPSQIVPPRAAGPAFLFGPEGQVFTEPVKITLPYDPTLVPAGASLVVYTAPAGSTEFAQMPWTRVDATHLQVVTSHFSVFAVGYAQAPADLASIAVSPIAPSIAASSTVVFAAVGTYNDATSKDITDLVVWSSSNTAVATIAAGGSARGIAAGTTVISAAYADKTGSTDLTVTQATLVSIAVTPTSPSLAAGTSQQLTATGSYSDGTTQDLTGQVVWSSSNTAVATVSGAANMAGRAAALAPGLSTLSATMGAIAGGTTLTVTAATLVSLAVTPTMPFVAHGTTQGLTATGTYSDNSTQDLTTQVAWSSSNPGYATVSALGVVTAVSAGATNISASIGGMSALTTLIVTPATLVSIAIAPGSPTLAKGTKVNLTATGTYTNASTQDLTNQVTWSSSMASRVAVSNATGSKGQVTAVDVGTSSVRATLNGVMGTTTVTVSAATLLSIAVTPGTATFAKGTTLPLTATGTYSDSSTQNLTGAVTWWSSSPAVAVVSNAGGSVGLATGVGAGSAIVSATLGTASGSANLTVTAATLVSLAVAPANPSIAKGNTRAFSVTGTYTDGVTQDVTAAATFASNNTAVATVSNAAGSKGLASGVAVGNATITATLSGRSGSTTLTVTAATLVSIAVTPAAPSIAKGATTQLLATGTYTDGTTQVLTSAVTWASGTPGTATVSNAAGTQGLVTSVAAGTTAIVATLGSVSGTTTVTVTPAALVTITVMPANPSIAAGLTQAFTATGVYSDASTQSLTSAVTWASATPAVATIAPSGLATSLAMGTTTITATMGGVSGSTVLTVTAPALVSIAVTPAPLSLARGITRPFTATGTYTLGPAQDVTGMATWTSGTPATATVSDAAGTKGVVTAQAVGTAMITATIGGVTGSAALTVTAPTLLSIAVTPATPAIRLGAQQDFVATGTYTDGARPLTTGVTWTSTAEGVATISSAGVATAVTAGTTMITATVGTETSPAVTLTVTAPVSIAITPADQTLNSMTVTSSAMIATGTYANATTADVTSYVTWTSSDPTKVIISNTAATKGLASFVAPGEVTITATVAGVSATTTLTFQ